MPFSLNNLYYKYIKLLTTNYEQEDVFLFGKIFIYKYLNNKFNISGTLKQNNNEFSLYNKSVIIRETECKILLDPDSRVIKIEGEPIYWVKKPEKLYYEIDTSPVTVYVHLNKKGWKKFLKYSKTDMVSLDLCF